MERVESGMAMLVQVGAPRWLCCFEHAHDVSTGLYGLTNVLLDKGYRKWSWKCRNSFESIKYLHSMTL